MPKFSLKKLFLGVALVAVALAAGAYFVDAHRYSDVRQVFGGADGFNLLRNPERVEVYRLDKPADRNKWDTAGVSDFPVIAGPISVSAADAGKLIEILQDRESYFWEARKACIPLPGVRIDFIRGQDRLQVLFCFECMILDTYRNGQRVGGQNFDYAFQALTDLVRQLFPNDPVIQSIGQKR